jgi:hypothetical protein
MPAECRTRSLTHSHHPLWTPPSSAICSSTLPREASGSCSRFCFLRPFSSPPALGGDDGRGLASRDRSPARPAGTARVDALKVRARSTIVSPRRRPRTLGGFMEPLPGPALIAGSYLVEPSPPKGPSTARSWRGCRGTSCDEPHRRARSGGVRRREPRERDRVRVQRVRRRWIPRPRRSESASGVRSREPHRPMVFPRRHPHDASPDAQGRYAERAPPRDDRPGPRVRQLGKHDLRCGLRTSVGMHRPPKPRATTARGRSSGARSIPRLFSHPASTCGP